MGKKKRPVLIIIGNNQNGGIAKRAAMLANGFSDSGQEATIVITKNKTEENFFELKGHAHLVHVEDNQINEKSYKAKWILHRTLLEIKILKTVSEFLPINIEHKKKINYTVAKKRRNMSLKKTILAYDNPIVIALGLDYAINAYFATRGIKCDLIYGTRTYAEGELEGQDTRVVVDILKKMSATVCQTSYTADYFRNMGINNVTVIGNPLELTVEPYTEGRRERIVNFCRISREKRLDLLIKVFEKFHKSYPNYQIEIYGNVHSDQEIVHKKELLNLIEELKLQECVILHDARKDIHDVVKDASMFISTSDFEGLSNSMIEAMAIGLPCICTDCDGGGARELIEDGVNGLLIPKGNEEALFEAMTRFAKDKKFAQSCGKNAIEIREKLKTSKIISQWASVIDNYCD